MMPKVSVILTVYNKPKWLVQSIESVLSQTLEDTELIIMEDNSPDPTVGYILNDYEGLPNVKIYRSDVSDEERFKTARYATLINKAVREFSTGEYITYLADDDYYYPQRCEVMANALSDHPEWEVVFSTQHVVDVDGNARGMRVFYEPVKKAWDAIDHNSVMHRRELFFDVGGWPDYPNAWGGADARFFREINDKGILFYPVAPGVPLEAKRYHTESVQWLIANGQFFPESE